LLATRMGVAAVDYLLEGETGIMVGLHGRDIGTVTLLDATTHERSVTESYVEMADMLAK